MTIIKKHTYKLPLLLCLLGAFAYLSACVDIDIDSGYSISNISEGQRYVGLAGETVPAGVTQAAMPEEILIHSEKSTSKLFVYLNGQAVGDLLDYGAGQAVLKVDKIQALLRQGKNTLSVEPLNFGPSVDFNFDNQGPMLDIAAVENINGAIQLTVRAQDTVSVKDVRIERMNYSFDGATEVVDGQTFKTDSVSATGEVTPLEDQGKGLWSAGNIQAADLYKIQAEDSYGYVTTDYYLAPNQVINNAFKLKLDKSVLDDVVPLMASKIEGVHMYSPLAIDDFGGGVYPTDENAQASAILDGMNRWWTEDAIFYGDTGAKTEKQSDCGYINVKNNLQLTSEDFVCTNPKTDALNGKKYCLAKDLKVRDGIDAKQGECSRIIVSRLQMDGIERVNFSLGEQAGELQLDMKIVKKDLAKALYTDMGIRNIECKSRHATTTFCRERDGTPSLGYWCSWGAVNEEQGIAVDSQGVPIQDLEQKAFGVDSNNAFCRDNGPAVIGARGAPLATLGDMKITADQVNPAGPVKVLIKDGDLDLSLAKVKLNFGGDLNVGGIGGDQGSGWDTTINGIVNGLKGTLDGMFVGIVEGTLKQNMKDFKLGFDLFSDQDVAESDAAGNVELENPSMQMQAKAYQVWTGKDASGAMRWNMYYSGYLHNVKNNADVGEVLGSRFVIEKPSTPIDSNREVDVSLNSNIINQALMSMYLSGVSHITVLDRAVHVNGESKQVFFGTNITDTLAVRSGAVRVELLPSTPGTFSMLKGDSTGSQAVIHYRNATMHIDTFRNGVWKTDFIVHADLRVGLLMKADDGRIKITLLGTPELDINSVQAPNAPNWFPGGILQPLVQFGVDLVANIAVPQITQNISDFDLPLMPIEGTDKAIQLRIDQLEANNGAHFGLGVHVDVVDNN